MATKTEYKEAIKGSRGVLSRIAERLGVTRSAVTLRLQKHKDLRLLNEQEKERMVDSAEETIYDISDLSYDPKTLSVTLRAAEKVVSTQGKDRGWVEKQEIDHGEGIKIIIERADDGGKQNGNENR